jgi:hypothetical protein
MTWLLEKLIAPFAPWLIAALLVANAVTGVMYWHRGNVIRDRDAALAAVTVLGEQAQRDKAAQEAKAKQDQQESIHAYQTQVSELGNRISALSRSLQNRPGRSDVPATPQAECTSHAAKGSELYRQDAEFLARESARADEIVIQLQACQRELSAAAQIGNK